VLLARQQHLVDERAKALQQHVHRLTARDGMGASGSIVYLDGFCPVDRVDTLSEAAGQSGWGILVRDPEAGDTVPTLIRNPTWVRPIKAVFDMIEIMPGYHEADISAVFLFFFSVFFAMLIGDAGYGLLFLLLTLFARRKLPKAPAYPFHLFGILSVCTMAWGVLTGNAFGIVALPGILQGLRVTWLLEQNNVMKLCFFIGAVHLSIAHFWNALILYPSLKSIAQIGWIALVWTMYFTACNMVLQDAFPPWVLFTFTGGLIAITLFMTSASEFKSEWIQHAMLPLSVVSCFVDVVSYVRLFAVGMASLSVAQSFNDMALSLGLSRGWTLILLVGHGLNILLCALGVLVHGVRLNTLEFSLHKNMEWSGVPYLPFCKNMQGEET
jgi:V/A-type H+-transporting ATPase subunit I